MEDLVCKSCGHPFSGYYCNQCGEKVVLPQERSLASILSSIMVAITNVDGKAIKSLWLVISKPGFLSAEITAGRTVKYVRPMSLFFVLNLVYFLFPLVQLFNATWKTQLGTVYGNWVLRQSVHKMLELDLPRSAFELMYNDKTVGYAKMLVIVFAVFASLPLNGLYKSTKKFFGDHLNLMVELACFNLFINALVITLLAKFLPIGTYLDDTVLTIFFIITNLYFLLRSGNVFYQETGIKLIAKSVLMIGVLKIALEAYRLVLFLITIWTL